MLNIFQKIVNEFPNSIEGPQNVFTIDNPDILVPVNGNLVGIYFLKKKELKQLDLLLRRIYMSKLAYSSAMTPLILITQNEYEQLSADDYQLLSNFRFVREYHDIKSSPADFLKSIEDFSTDYFHPALQNKIIRRLWLIKSFSKEYYPLIKTNQFRNIYSKETGHSNQPIEYWSQSTHSIKNAYIINDGDLFVEKETSQGFVSSFENVLTYSMMYSFKIENNGFMSEQKSNKYKKILNTNWDFSAPRNNIYFNTLAFLGILPVEIGGIDCLKEIDSVFTDYTWKYKPKRY